MALSVTAFAAGEQIKVVDAGVGTYDFAAYKVFEAGADSDGVVSYLLPAGSAWVDELIVDTSADPLVSAFPGLEFTAVTGGYSVKKLTNFSAADFAEFLSGKIAATPSAFDSVKVPAAKITEYNDPADPKNDTVEIDIGGQPGYYLITSGTDPETIGADPYALTTVLEDQKVTVQNKHDIPFDKEVYNGTEAVDEQGVQIGDNLKFTVTGKLPTVASGDTFYYYYIKDTLSKGFLFDKTTFKVTIGTDVIPLATFDQITDLTAKLSGNQYRFDDSDPDKFSFDISVDLVEKPEWQGKDIVIEYYAKVTEDAAGAVVNNKANLTYGNDPNHLINKDDETRNYVSQIIIDKFETGNNAQKLSGAEFVLYKVEAGTKSYFRYNTDTEEVVWVSETDLTDSDKPGDDAIEDVASTDAAKTITKVVTESDGSAKYIGLEDGTYYLLEIKSPDGYVKLDSPVEVIVNGKAALDPALSEEQQMVNLTQIAHIANTPGSVLPSTGGSGTTLFYIFGIALIVISGAFLVFRRREEKK